MATRSCSSCHKNLPKSEYSKNQWTKKDSSKCKSCVTGDGSTTINPATATDPTSVPVTKDELFVSIGDVHVAGEDDAKSLQQLNFQTGDYLSVAIY